MSFHPIGEGVFVLIVLSCLLLIVCKCVNLPSPAGAAASLRNAKTISRCLLFALKSKKQRDLLCDFF